MFGVYDAYATGRLHGLNNKCRITTERLRDETAARNSRSHLRRNGMPKKFKETKQ